MHVALKDGFDYARVHATPLGLLVERFVLVGCQQGHIGLLIARNACLVEQLADHVAAFRPVALGHAVVHQNQFMQGLAPLESALDYLEGRVAVGAVFRCVVELFNERLNRHHVEGAVVDHED